MEEQLKFIQSQIDKTNTNMAYLTDCLKYSSHSDSKEAHLISEMLSRVASVMSSQQALIESMFNLLKSKIN